MSQGRWLALVIVVAGCGGDEPAPAPVSAPPLSAPTDRFEPPLVVTLPTCDLACDRVVDCAVDGCAGFDWTTAGSLAASCYAACDADGGFPASVLGGTPACDQVLTAAGPAVPDLGALCDSNPCKQGCETLGGCLVVACAAFADSAASTVAEECASACVPADIAWVLDAPDCDAVMAPVLAANAQLAAACDGTPPTCADPAACDTYAAKIVGCMGVHCGPPLDGWLAALEAVFLEFCADPVACPDAEAVAFLVADEVDCDAPSLVDVGPGPPFGALCDGSATVDPATAEAACAALLACPGTESTGSMASCSVWLAVRPDAALRAACLTGAAGDCTAVAACLEDW